MKSPNIRLLMALSLWSFLMPANGAYALKTLMIINNNGTVDTPGPLHFLSSTPHDRQTLDVAPTSVSITFSQPIRPDKSFIRVYNLAGDQLDVGELGIQGNTASVTLPELTDGKYTVKWRAHCQCADETEVSNSFHFTLQ